MTRRSLSRGTNRIKRWPSFQILCISPSQKGESVSKKRNADSSQCWGRSGGHFRRNGHWWKQISRWIRQGFLHYQTFVGKKVIKLGLGPETVNQEALFACVLANHCSESNKNIIQKYVQRGFPRTGIPRTPLEFPGQQWNSPDNFFAPFVRGIPTSLYFFSLRNSR